MAISADYRAKARAVRAEARRKLQSFRAERRAALRAPATPTPVVEAAPTAYPEMADMEVSAEAAAFAAGALAPIADADVAEHNAPDPAFATMSDAAADMAEPSCDAVDAPAPPIADDASTEPDLEPSPSDLETGEPDAESGADLDQVPGVGPGLVWMLRKAGVTSVAELLAADAEALSQRLGLVGRLVDVEALKAAARR